MINPFGKVAAADTPADTTPTLMENAPAPQHMHGVAAAPAQVATTAAVAHTSSKPAITSKLVIEEVSIDGMCGVY